VMRDIPIIFSAPMVRALLGGRKTMTRRLAWRDPHIRADIIASEHMEDYEIRGWQVEQSGALWCVRKPSPWQKVKPGDRLWVRENFRYTTWDDDCQFRVKYEADGVESKWIEAFDGDDAESLVERICTKLDKKSVPIEDGHYVSTDALGITPCIHMPRWASRLTLVVTATKIERLQDISGPDSIAEGVECPTCTAMGKSACNRLGCFASQGAFSELWSRLHGRESWDANPEVVALTFAVHRCNIDNLPPQPASSPQAAAPGGDPALPPGKPFNDGE